MFILFLIEKLFLFYTILLFVRILGSWLPELQGQRWMQFVAFYTDPYLNFFRRFIPAIGMVDISPIIAFLCLGFIEKALKFIVIQLLT